MIPGLTSKLSESTVTAAATIVAKTDIVRISGTTSIATIKPNFGGGFSGILFLVPVTGNVATLTTGNIVGSAVTMLQNKVTVLVYSKTDAKWYTHALS
jgi:uncharacterized membrane protein